MQNFEFHENRAAQRKGLSTQNRQKWDRFDACNLKQLVL